MGSVDGYRASDFPLELLAGKLFQGPIADVLTHTGRIAMLRRLAGAPLPGRELTPHYDCHRPHWFGSGRGLCASLIDFEMGEEGAGFGSRMLSAAKTLRTSPAALHYPGMDDQQRRRAIDATLVQLDKQFGKGSVLRLGSSNVVPVSVISTGSISIDAALGVGGVPRGRVVEIFGPESSGKTTLALQVVAEAQRLGGNAAFIDAEHALDPVYARKLGVDVDNLLVSQPDCGEQALEITGALVASGAVDVVVVDSVAALVPRAELEGEMGDSHMGLHARLMSQALRKLTGAVSKTNTCMIFINQIREKIGVMFGSPETTTGGRALKFYASVRLDIRRIAAIKDGDAVIGNRTRVKVVKNKVASPFREAEFDILYGEGTSKAGDLLDLGVTHTVVEKSGSWFSYAGERIGQGRDNARQFLKENPAVMEKLDAQLRKQLGLLATAEPASGEASIANGLPGMEPVAPSKSPLNSRN